MCFRSPVVAAFALGACAQLLPGQAGLGTAEVSGIVRDQQGGAVLEAKIVLTEKSKGLTRESSSDAAGSFLFPAVGAGLYKLVVAKEGFRTQILDDVRLEVGQRATLEVPLTVGDIKTTISISSGDMPLLETQSNAIGTVIDSARVRDLPLNGHYLLQLALLAGGTAEASTANNGFAVNIGQPARVVLLPGTLPYSVGYSLNGIPVRGSRDGELVLNFSTAAVDHFKVEEGFLMPDQGPNAGVVNIATRSGGSRFHGEAFELVRNVALDARNFFATRAEDLKRNQFGASLGGPVWKDRIWFHAFYEGTRQITAFTSAGYSPTAGMFAGNFAETGQPIYDPASFSSVSGLRQPFPNSAIPADRINPVAKNLSKYYMPGSSLSSRPSNLYGNPRNTIDDDQWGVRVDTALNSRQQLFAQFFHQNAPSVQRGLYPLTGLIYENRSDLAHDPAHDVVYATRR